MARNLLCYEKILGIPTKEFLESQLYHVFFTVTNLGTTVFPGGKLIVQVNWPNGQKVRFEEMDLPKLDKDHKSKTKKEFSTVLSKGFGLFKCIRIESIDGNDVKLWRNREDDLGTWNGMPNDIVKSKDAFHTIYGKPVEEIYTLYALMIAAASLLILILESLNSLLT